MAQSEIYANPYDQFDPRDETTVPADNPTLPPAVASEALQPGQMAVPLDADPTIAGTQAQKHVDDNMAADKAREDSSASAVFGDAGKLDQAGQDEWIKGEKQAAVSGQTFWNGVKQYVVQPLQSINDAFASAAGLPADPNAPRDPFVSLVSRNADKMVSLNKRREFLANQMADGTAEAAKLGTIRNAAESLAQGVGDTGFANIVSGFGRGSDIVNDAVDGPAPELQPGVARSDRDYFTDLASGALAAAKHNSSVSGTALEAGTRAYATTMRHLGAWISAKTKQYFPGDEARQFEWGTKLANGAGSMIAFMGPSLGVSLLTRATPEALGTLAMYGDTEALMALAKTQAERGALATAAGLGAPMQAESAASDAEDAQRRGVKKADGSDITDDDIKAAYLWNLPVGATEALPLEHLMQSWGTSPLKAIAMQMAQEGGQEFIQQVGENWAAQHYYDPERSWDDGAWESGAIGAILGAHTEIATHALEKGGEAGTKLVNKAKQIQEARLRSKGVINDIEPIASGPDGETPAAEAQSAPVAPAVAVQPDKTPATEKPLKAAPAWPEEELEPAAGMTQGSTDLSPEQASANTEAELDPELADFRDLVGEVPTAEETGTPSYVERLTQALRGEPETETPYVSPDKRTEISEPEASPQSEADSESAAVEQAVAPATSESDVATERASVDERLAGLNKAQLSSIYKDVIGTNPAFGSSKVSLAKALTGRVFSAGRTAARATQATHELYRALTPEEQAAIPGDMAAARAPVEDQIHAAIDKATAAGVNAKQAPAAATSGGMQAENSDAPQRFREMLRGETPSKKWAKELGITPDELKPLIKMAVKQGLIRKGAGGVVRRTPLAKQSGNELGPNKAKVAAAAKNAEIPGTPENLAAREVKAREFMRTPEWLGGTLGGSNFTTEQPGFMSPEWKANRVYNVVDADGKPTGQTIHGYAAAIAHLAAKIEAKIEGGLKYEQKAYVLIGYPGAGKGTVSTAISNEKGAAHITCDDAKLLIPEYEEGWNSAGVHDESAEMAADVVVNFVGRGANLIYEKVGSSDNSIAKPLAQFRKAGYATGLVYVDVPKPVAMERAISRFKRTGRSLPMSYYDELNISDVYSILKQEGAADETTKVNWNERGEQGWTISERGPSLAGLAIGNRSGSNGPGGQPALGEPSRGQRLDESPEQVQRGQGSDSLAISPDARVDRLIRQREEATGETLPSNIYEYANRLETARGNNAEFAPIMAEIRADKGVTKRYALELAHVVGVEPRANTTKAQALASIEDRHQDFANTLEARNAERSGLDESQGAVPATGVSEGLQGVEGLGVPGSAPEGDRTGSPGYVRGSDGLDADQRAGIAEGLSGQDGGASGDTGAGAGIGQSRIDHEAARQRQRDIEDSIEADRAAERDARADRNRANYEITPEDKIGQGGAKAKVKANIEALRILQKLDAEGRDPTDEEKKALVKYVGWGAFAQDVFASHKPEWAKERAALQDLLTPDEYKSARASVLNAHYTSEDVIRGMWGAMRHLGFEGGRALEPSAGIGHFIGLEPGDLSSNTDWSAVELDSVSGRITKALYGAADVRVQGFESVEWPDDFFDLSISNVPFGSFNLEDKDRKGFLIHDYFFLKALAKTRPGGIVAFISSKGTLDKANARARNAMERQATFLGAIRLPGGSKGAFKANAGTDVTTDIIFMRKRVDGEPAGDQTWLGLKEIKTPDGPAMINAYFAEHPEMMLGKMRLQGTMHTADEPVLIGSTDGIEGKIIEAAKAGLPEGAMLPRSTTAAALTPEIDTSTLGKPGGFYQKDGKTFRIENGVGVAQKLNAADTAKMGQFLGLRDTINAMLAGQQTEGFDATKSRERLNKLYDNFVAEHGQIKKTIISTQQRADKEITIRRMPNFSLFEDDPDAYKVAAIESYDQKTGTAKKTAIFNEDILGSYERPDITGPTDALSVSLNETGKVDMGLIARALGVTEREAINQLGDSIYLNPKGDEWTPREQYLAGDVVQKLEDAQAAAKTDGKYERNVEALKAAQPEPLTRLDIRVNMGAPWIPRDVYQEFVADVMGVRNVNLVLNQATNAWGLNEKPYFPPSAQAQYGTERKSPGDILEAAMNAKQIQVFDTVTDEHGKDARVINAAATQEANARVQALRDSFNGNTQQGVESWLWSSDSRAERLEPLYNYSFNRLAPEKYDGSHLTFPGLARVVSFPDGGTGTINLTPHRVNAVWRIIRNGNAMLGHVVGSGKTWTMIMAAMEEKRLGLIQKPMFVVPNHMLEQFSNEFLQAYPNAKLLIASKDEMSVKKRREFVARTAADKWDGVIITHDAFGRVPMSDQAYKDFYEKQIEEINAIIEEQKREQGAKSPTVKDSEKRKKSIKNKLDKLLNKDRKDVGTTFEEMGIDKLYVDEAHLFKNLSFYTQHNRVKGISNSSESQRATDLYVKIQHLEKARPGRSNVFATGTPVSNTMAELYTMQRYQQNDELKKYGIESFDAWANTFGQMHQEIERTVDGQMRSVTSFSKFINIPELMAIWSRVADIQTADMLNLPRPALEGGKIGIIEAQASDAEREYMESLVKRAEALKTSKIDPTVDNMLKIVSEGRKVATDMRLLDHKSPFNEQGKIAKAVDEIYKDWQDGKEPALAQMVFLDMGVPGSKGGAKPTAPVKETGGIEAPDAAIARIQQQLNDEATADGTVTPDDIIDELAQEKDDFFAGLFNLYEDMRERLVAKGIPREQMAFIHEAKNDEAKERMFEDVRAGKIRVIWGSTPKMGVGTNAQKRLITLHHIDAPWKPAEVEQRDGRILRQGNLNKSIRIKRYVTRNSFDAYMWQLLERKAKFIGQLLSGARGARDMEDIDNPLPEAAALKAAASGDPRILEHATLSKEIADLEVARRAHFRAAQTAKASIAVTERQITNLSGYLEQYTADADKVTDTSGDNFKMDLETGRNPQTFTDRKAAGEAIRDYTVRAAENMWYSGRKTIELGKISGFDMSLESQRTTDGFEVRPIIQGNTDYRGVDTFYISADSNPVAIVQRFERLVRQVPNLKTATEIALRKEQADLPRQQKAAEATKFPKQDALDKAIASRTAIEGSVNSPIHDAPEATPEVPVSQMAALTAHHGTRHTFDRFSSAKIGEGEGAQAYGYGLYFAGNPQVARTYKNVGAKAEDVYHIFESEDEAKKAAGEGGEAMPYRSGWVAETANSGIIKKNPGNIYQVSLDVEPEKLVDLDKSYSAQSAFVKAALKPQLDSTDVAIYPSVDGMYAADVPGYGTVGPNRFQFTLRREIAAILKNDANRKAFNEAKLSRPIDQWLDFKTKAGSAALAAAGLDGIQYRDGLSRDGRGSEEGHNYVVFDDRKINITHKNGDPVTPQEHAAQAASLLRPGIPGQNQSQSPPPPLTPRAQQMAPEIAAKIEDELRAALPREVAVRVADQLFLSGYAATGLTDFKNRLVEISLASGEGRARETSRHEIIHALRGDGAGYWMQSLYTGDEWQTLVDRAKKTLAGNIVGQDNLAAYREIYGQQTRGNPAHVQEAMNQELVAHMAETWADGATYGTAIDRLLYRVQELVAAIGRALRALGFNTPSDIFGTESDAILRKSFSGEIANRGQGQQQAIKDGGPSQAASLPLEQQISDEATPGEDMSEDARRQRAESLGFDFDTPYYHGSGATFDAFSREFLGTNWKDIGGTGQGFFFTTKKPMAERFATGKNGNVLDARLRLQNPFVLNVDEALKREVEKVYKFAGSLQGMLHKFITTVSDKLALFEPEFDRMSEYAWKHGFDSVVVDFGDKSPYGKFVIVPDPSQIRDSRAAFNPKEADSAHLMASLIGKVGAKNLAAQKSPAAEEALNIAQEMENYGANRDQIWRATSNYLQENDTTGELIGAYKGVDGKWRVEVDDSKVEPTLHAPGANVGTVPEMLPHPALEAAHPNLEDASAVLKYNPIRYAAPSGHATGDNFMRVNGSTPEDIASVGMHEYQHLLQAREDFARGTSPEEAEKRFTPNNGFDGYRRSAGEVESRLVQKRLDMTADERREHPPYLDYDVSEDKQIVHFDNGKPTVARSLAPEEMSPKLQGTTSTQVRTPTKSQPVEALATIISDLKSALGMTSTQGRYGLSVTDRTSGPQNNRPEKTWRFKPQASLRGQYHRRVGAARYNLSTDIEAIAHEGGHHLETMLGVPLDQIKRQHADELRSYAYRSFTPAAQAGQAPQITSPTGYSGINLDSEAQRLLTEAIAADGAAVSTGTPEAKAKDQRLRAELEYRLGTPTADAVFNDAYKHAQSTRSLADLPQYVQSRFSETGVPAQAKTDSRASLSEGFAEFFREYLLNPEQAKKFAPEFYSDFEDLLDARAPALLQNIERAQLGVASKAYDDYLKATTLDRARADLVSEADQSWGAKLADTAVLKSIGQGSTISGAMYRTFSDAMGRVYSALVDENHPWYLATKELLQQADQNGVLVNGRPATLAIHQNPYKLIRSVADSFKTGLRWIQDGVPNYRESGGQRSASLHQALTLVMGKKWNLSAYQDFGVYLESRRAVEEWKVWNAKRGAMAKATAMITTANAQNRVLREELAKAEAKLERRNSASTGNAAVMKEYDRVMQELVTREGNIVRELQEGQVATPGMTPQQERNARLRLADVRQKLRSYDERQKDFVVRRNNLNADRMLLQSRVDQLNGAIAKRGAVVDRSREHLNKLRDGGIQRDPHRIGQAEHEARIAELEKLYPNLPQAAQMVYDFNWQSAVHDFQAGRLTKAELDYRATRRHFYVPFARDLSDIMEDRGVGGRKGVQKFAKDKTFEGSDRAIVNPIETIIDQTFHRAAATHFNDVMKSFINLADAVGPGAGAVAERVTQSDVLKADSDGFNQIKNRLVSLGYNADDAQEMVKRIESDFGDTQLLLQWSPEGFGPNRPLLLPLWENGERKLIRLNDPEWSGMIYNSVNGMGREMSNLIMDVLAKPASLLRWSVTTNPAFVIPNIVRDMWSAWILTGNVLSPKTWPMVTQARGLYHEFAQTDMARLYQEVAGIMGGQNVAALSKVRDKSDVMALKARGMHLHPLKLGAASVIGSAAGFAVGGPAGSAFGAMLGAGLSNGPKHFWETMSHFSDISETATRLGVFANAYKAALSYNPSLTPYQAGQEAAYVARDLIDFGRRGSNMLVAARLVPFLNANVQGLDKAVRTLLARSDRGYQLSIGKIAAAGGLGATAGYLASGAALGSAGAFVLPAAAVAFAARSDTARRLLAPFSKRITGLPLSEDETRILGESAKAWTNLLVYTGILAVMGALSGGGDPDEYKMINDRIKHRSQPVKLGGDWYQVPKAFEFSVPANIIEAGMNMQFDNDPRFWERVRDTVAENISPPGLPQSAKLWSDIRGNYNSMSGGEIVPDWQKRSLPPQEQFNAYTSQVAISLARAVNNGGMTQSIAEGIGQTIFGPGFEVSPAMIDYAISTGGGYWGKDIQKASNLVADRTLGPSTGRVIEYPVIGTLLQRLSIDPNRANDALDSYYQAMAPTGQSYSRVAGGYDFILQNQGQGPANAYLSTLDDDHKAYALLQATSDQQAKRSHPLNRLKDVLGSVRSMGQDLAYGRLADTSDKQDPKPITLSPSVAAEVRDTLAKISAIEAWNTMVTLGAGQFKDRHVMDIKPTMDTLRAESPQAADELQLRYDRKHVVEFDVAKDVWPETRDELLTTWHELAPTNQDMPNPKKRRGPKLPGMMRLGGPVPPLGNGSIDPEDTGIGYPTNVAPDNAKFDEGIVQPPAQSGDTMREIPPVMPNNMPPEFQPPENSPNNVDQQRWKQNLM